MKILLKLKDYLIEIFFIDNLKRFEKYCLIYKYTILKLSFIIDEKSSFNFWSNWTRWSISI